MCMFDLVNKHRNTYMYGSLPCIIARAKLKVYIACYQSEVVFDIIDKEKINSSE